MVKKNITGNTGHKKPVHTKQKINKKSTPKKSLKFNAKQKELLKRSAIAVILILAILAIFLGLRKEPKQEGIAAKVGDYYITVQELDLEYGHLPEYYQAFITKDEYLETVMVPQKLLSIKSSDITDIEIDTVYNGYLIDSGLTEKQMLELLAEQGITLEKFREVIRIQIFLNQTFYDKITVNEDDIVSFYNSQKDMFIDELGNVIPLDELRDDIENFLYNELLQQAASQYVEIIKEEIEVEIYYNAGQTTKSVNLDKNTNVKPVTGVKETSQIKTFQATGDELCTENGKPLVMLFSTTWCGHCAWIKDTFDSTVKEYEGKIAAYHWQIDTGDNTLSSIIESEVPKSYLDIYRKYNPRGSIPTFVFGCEYTRIGNGYGRENDLKAEAAEFRAVIEALLA
jgi:thiol-disulfide isomerase/thioredoxin